MVELEESDIAQLSATEKTKYRYQYLAKYLTFIVLFILMISYGLILHVPTKKKILHLIGLIGVVCIFIYNKTNVVRTYGACNNPYADFSSRIKTIVSFQCNFILFILKSMFITLGAILVCSLIGQSIELHTSDNLKAAFMQYNELMTSVAKFPAIGLIIIIPFIIFVIIFCILHTTTFLVCTFKIFWGGEFFTVFFKKEKPSQNEPVEIIFYTIYNVMNLTSFKNNIIAIGTIVSLIIGVIIVIMVDPCQACRDIKVQNKIVTAMDYQMAIGWIIAFVMYINYFKKLIADYKNKKQSDSSSDFIERTLPGKQVIKDISSIWAVLPGGVSAAAAAAAATTKNLPDTASKAGKDIKDSVKEAGQNVGEGVGAVGKAIVGDAKAVMEAGKDGVKAGINKAVDSVKAGINKAKGAVAKKDPKKDGKEKKK